MEGRTEKERGTVWSSWGETYPTAGEKQEREREK